MNRHDVHVVAYLLAVLPSVWLLGCTASTPAARQGDHVTHADRRPLGMTEAYALEVCARCEARLGTRGESLAWTVNGRELRVCGPACLDAAKANSDASFAHADALMVADQRPWYPIETSIVSGRSLGSEALDVIVGNRLFRLAASEEYEVLLRDLPRWWRTLDDEVVARQSAGYPLPTKCPVQGDILDSDVPRDVVVANRMIRVCCERCARMVRARPTLYLGIVECATRQAQPEPRSRDRDRLER